jgi:hypothetical protein
MLDGGNGDAFLVSDDRAEREILDVTNLGGDLGGDAAAFRDNETEPSVGYCGMQDYRNWRSTMYPRAMNLDCMRNRRLSRANESIRHAAPSLDAFWHAVPRRLAPPAGIRLAAHSKFPDFLLPGSSLNGELEGRWVKRMSCEPVVIKKR